VGARRTAGCAAARELQSVPAHVAGASRSAARAAARAPRLAPRAPARQTRETGAVLGRYRVQARRPLRLRLERFEAWVCIHRHEAAWNDRGDPYWGRCRWIADHARLRPRHIRRHHGGLADTWTPAEQIVVAERAYSTRGFAPWPQTARSCGLVTRPARVQAEEPGDHAADLGAVPLGRVSGHADRLERRVGDDDQARRAEVRVSETEPDATRRSRPAARSACASERRVRLSARSGTGRRPARAPSRRATRPWPAGGTGRRRSGDASRALGRSG